MSKNIVIYQMEQNEQTHGFKFWGLDYNASPEQREGSNVPLVDMSHYKPVFGEYDVQGMILFRTLGTDEDLLNSIFTVFNQELDSVQRIFGDNDTGFTGHSLSVSDIVRINDKYYFCDSVGWEQIDVENVPQWIQIGMGATMGVGTDAYPYHVSRITASGKTVYIKRADWEVAEGHNYYGEQKYNIIPREDVPEEAIRQRKNGRWYTASDSPVSIGFARHYEDPHF